MARKGFMAKYGTERGAQRYADECKAAWPEREFKVCAHPRDPFRYGVLMSENGRSVAYVTKRPRGGIKRV